MAAPNNKIIFYSIFTALGLCAIIGFVMYIQAHEEEESAGEVEFQANGLNKLNAKVQKEGTIEYDEKIDLYDADLEAKKKEQEQLAEHELEKKVYHAAEKRRLNDLTEFLDKDKADKKEDSRQAVSTEAEPVREQSQFKQENRKPVTIKKQTSVASSTIVKRDLPTSTTEKSTKKRRRNNDISFGNDEVSQPVSTAGSSTTTEGNSEADNTTVFYQAKVHGKQVIGDGSRLTIRVIDEIPTSCGPIAPNTMLTGLVSMANQRMIISFTVCGKTSNPLKMYAYDATDQELGIYVDNISVNQEIKRDVAEKTAGSVANDLGIPVVGNVLSSGSSKKINSITVPMDANKSIYLKFKAKDDL